MPNFFKSNIIQLAVIALMLVGLFRVTQAAKTPLDALPVIGMTTTQQQNTETYDNLKNLYPLISIHHQKMNNTAANSEDSIDKAFDQNPDDTQSKKQAINYFQLLKDNHVLKLQAITEGGAIITGHYINFGQAITSFSYPGARGQLDYPILKRTNIAGTVQIIGSGKNNQFLLSLKP